MSPIKGLTENRRLIRLGKIHLGIKVEKLDPKTGEPVYNTRGEIITYPKATTYFVCPPEVQAVYGEHPDRLDIIIPVEDEEFWCSQYYRQYSRTRGLICKGDGETCNRKIDRQTGDIANRESKEVVWREMSCAGQACPDYQGKKCKEVMNLQFMLPRVPGLGIWQIDTGSVNSIRNINDNADMLRAVCDRVSWIPLTLTLEPKEVINPDDGKKKVVRCLNIRQDKGLIELLAAKDKPRATLFISMPDEDQEPLDETREADVIEGEFTTTDTAAPDNLEKELFGEAEEAGVAVPEEGQKNDEPTGAAAPAKLKLKRDPETIKTINDLLKACNADFKLQPKDVCKELGYSSQAGINEKPSICYQKIAAMKK